MRKNNGRVSHSKFMRQRNAADSSSRLGLTKTGQGARIEAISRGVIALIVPGGSEDVMIDLGVREALKLSKAGQSSKSRL